MATFQLFDQLLQFPLFLGMSRDDLSQIAGHTKLDFLKEPAHSVLYRSDTTCTHLCFLLSGTVTAETRSDDGSYSLTEQMSAPVILQPEALFGYQQRYTHTGTSERDVPDFPHQHAESAGHTDAETLAPALASLPTVA